MKRYLMVLFVFGMLFLAACGGSDDEETNDTSSDNGDDTATNEVADGEVYQIGASQIVEHPSLDLAYEGFMEAIEDAGLEAEFDFQSAQNDQNNIKPISDGFVADQVDLIFANSTPSALGALQATSDIPILFTSVTDAVKEGLVPSMDEAGENITGVVDLHPDAIESTVDFIAEQFPEASIGMVYNAGEPNSVNQVEQVREVAEAKGLEIVERSVANSSEVQQATTTLISDVDVFYIVTDNIVVSAIESVVGVANDNGIPLIVGESESLEKGAFATFGIDYRTIGYRAGEMAVEILTGEKTVQEIAPEYPAEIQLFINKDAAEKQGVEWDEAWDTEAQFVE